MEELKPGTLVIAYLSDRDITILATILEPIDTRHHRIQDTRQHRTIDLNGETLRH